MILRPRFAVVALLGQGAPVASGTERDTALATDRAADPGRAGQSACRGVVGEVVDGEPAP